MIKAHPLSWTEERISKMTDDQVWDQLSFETAEDGSSSPASRLEINKDGHVYVKTGSVVLSTAGQGINFSATSDASGMTSELLDDYEQGTFTPIFDYDSGASGITHSQQQGQYT